jgi:hypothetical protein
MKYLIELIKTWNHIMKYEVFDNSLQVTFKFGGGFQAIMTNTNVTIDKNWDLELVNTISHHRDKIATGESLEVLKLAMRYFSDSIVKENPLAMDNINLN